MTGSTCGGGREAGVPQKGVTDAVGVRVLVMMGGDVQVGAGVGIDRLAVTVLLFSLCSTIWLVVSTVAVDGDITPENVTTADAPASRPNWKRSCTLFNRTIIPTSDGIV